MLDILLLIKATFRNTHLISYDAIAQTSRGHKNTQHLFSSIGFKLRQQRKNVDRVLNNNEHRLIDFSSSVAHLCPPVVQMTKGIS